MATLPPSSSSAAGVLASPESEGPPGDFLLFDDSWSGQFRGSNGYPTSQDLFHQPLPSSMPLTEFLGDSNMNDLHSSHMANLRYTQSMANELPLGSSAPTYASFGGYSSADIPRTMSAYLEESSNTPGVLIHPPTLPYHHQFSQQQVDYSHIPNSPATTMSGFAGSEAGSAANSPLPPSLNLNDSHIFNPTTFVDPSLISNSPSEERHDPISAVSSHNSPNIFTVHSPAPTSNPGSPDLQRKDAKSPSMLVTRYTPYPARRPSTSSLGSRKSHGSPIPSGLEFENEMYPVHPDIMAPPARSNSQGSRGSRQGRAPSSNNSGDSPLGSGVGSTSGQSTNAKDGKDSVCPECNKGFRDLRAHLLTHQLERPEKCPIATCEYSKKGFARKYDCQRHTLTHYKGTMVCGFCPGSGSAMEKSFNRADVFKRHLMAVHNVEQTPPNGRKKPSKPTRHPEQDLFAGGYATGKCSTCGLTFPTAQEFYEHLDECVLSKVVEEEPAAVFNEHNLDQVNLEEVEAALAVSPRRGNDEDDDEDMDDDVEEAEDDGKDGTFTVSSRGKSSASSKRTVGTRGSKLKRSGSGKSN